MSRSLSISAVLCLATAGCAATSPRAASPTTVTAASTPSPGATVVDRVMVVPRPARTFARLRTLLRAAPSAAAPVERVLAGLAPFDLEEPMLYVEREGTTITSFGINRETAQRLRAGGSPECDTFEVGGKPRIACQVGKDHELSAEGRLLGAIAPPSARSDLHFEMTGAALAREVGKTPDSAPALPLFARMSGMTLDVSLEGTPEVRLAFAVPDASDDLTRALFDAPVAPPPATFFRLPADAELALFAHAPSGPEMAKVQSFLSTAFVGAIASDCSADEKRAAEAELSAIAFTGGSIAFGAGFDRARAEKAAASGDAKKLKDAERPWVLVGVDEPAERWKKSVSWLATHGCGKHKTSATATKPAARLGLPAGTLEILDRGEKDVTFVVPDGAGRTWVAVGPDEAALAARVRATLKGDANLGGRAGLASLRGPSTFGGFVTASSIAWLGHPADVERARAIASLPTGGRTPVTFRGSFTREGNGGSVATRVALEPAALADLAVVLGPEEEENTP